jgi:hypothetical protein
MNPNANRADARLPATGLSAPAAWAALVMLVPPCRPRVDAVAVMMANMTRLDRAIPVKTSKRLVRCLPLAPRVVRRSSGTGSSPPASSARISSTRLAVCQKNRYGEIVVPRTANQQLEVVLGPGHVRDDGVDSDAGPRHVGGEQDHNVGQ